MPAGKPYFAWIDPTETAFGPEHLRWDEGILSFTLQQSEGDPASLTIAVRRPRNAAGDPIGLLGPGRKIWCWFAFDCGPDLIRFRGRLVGVPTSLFEDQVTLEFVARPIDLVAQKEALAQTLRVLPFYDELVIDPAQRTDPEVVLEGYTAIWHYDRETHVLTISDEITGEDGVVAFDGTTPDATVLYDGLALSLTSGPLSRVDVAAEFTWTQQATGKVDLTKYLIGNWPESGPNYVTSLSMTHDNWPKTGADIGDGWIAAEATASSPDDLEVYSRTGGSTLTVKFPDTSWFGPSSFTTTATSTDSFTNAPVGIFYQEMVTKDDVKVKTSPDEVTDVSTVGGIGSFPSTYTSSYSRNTTSVSAVLPLNKIVPTLVAGYTANRQCIERVAFSLYADVQHVLTDPEDGEALRIDDVRSVNLSEMIGSELPIGDTRRRSYIATDRGNRSLEHLIALARANLMKRARVVEIEFAPKLARMPEITLRKDAILFEPRIGTARGKIMGYSLSLSGADGKIACMVRIGCAIGRGGSAVVEEGEPTYCSIDYVGADYQQFTGRTVLFDSSVGYQPPAADPNDDGIDLLSTLRAEDVIATGLVVENPTSVQIAYVSAHANWSFNSLIVSPSTGGFPTSDEQRQAAVEARSTSVANALKECETRATFKLKSMSREFTSEYEVQVTDLKIPTGYDLEAA